jgi:membrane fusion protein, multidrug efflux system
MNTTAPNVADGRPAEQASVARQTAQRDAPARPIGARVLPILPRLLAIVLAGGLAAVVILDWNRWVGAAGAQWTDNAYLQADLTPLSAQVTGRIRAVAVGDFQRVRQGELLVEIDDAPFRAQLDQAEANVAAAEAAIGNLKAQENLQAANIAAAEAQLRGNQATAQRDKLEADRQ